ncbi:thiamine kinase-like enzyme [Bacillus ectoiniformans]|uniref:phosphotransferase family protein n=1 Tax=Bacillus ectoiniformans TaxID=1494429 RepID=UPI00195C5B79|nr:phosphotransferase family protein [Bacillus ectoiniformans]MBM7649673.1 thiamine kinase-like enzyme [Bacillus ectoiniformans]
MEHLLGTEWKITPAGGATGKAYVARHDGQQLFLKRNSSPFLAVLSAEGIVPKLIWTKRLENGDVISAQHWLNGRELHPKEMGQSRVAKLMSKIHSSQPLLSMLERLGKKNFQPAMMLKELKDRMDEELRAHPDVMLAFQFMSDHLSDIQHEEYVVCHSDVNHNNWLLSDDDQLFLIDWDGAMIGDPAIDLGMLLHEYVEEDQWESWLLEYGLTMTPHLKLRMQWYMLAQVLLSTQWNKEANRFHEMNKRLAELHRFFF